MTPEELIDWHAHQITCLPQTDNVVVKHHREAMHCIERLRAELIAAQKRNVNLMVPRLDVSEREGALALEVQNLRAERDALLAGTRDKCNQP